MYIKLIPPTSAHTKWEALRCYSLDSDMGWCAHYYTLADFIRARQAVSHIDGKYQYVIMHGPTIEEMEFIEDTDEAWVALMLRYSDEVAR